MAVSFGEHIKMKQIDLFSKLMKQILTRITFRLCSYQYRKPVKKERKKVVQNMESLTSHPPLRRRYDGG